MPLDLSSIDLKVERAHKHLLALFKIQVAYAESPPPFAVRIDALVSTGLPLYRLVAVKTPGYREPPAELALVAGEALHQLRSSLNYIVHQLTGPDADERTRRKAQYPICRSADEFAKQKVYIRGVPPRFASLIELQQPFRRMPDHATDDPLWHLQALNNTDKHKLLPTVIVSMDVVTATDDGGTAFTVQSDDIVLKHGEPLFTFTRARPVQATLACAPAFAEAMSPHGVTLSIAGLVSGVYCRVCQVIDEFRAISEPTP